MKIHYFCTHWGNQLPFQKFCKNAVNAGYNGVEMDLPLVKKKRNEIVETLADHGLLLIGQYWQSLEKDFNLNEKNFKKHLYNLAEVNPVMINTQTGKDYFSFAQNMQLVNAAKTIAAETGLSEHTAFKYIRGVKVPTDYPENEEDWRRDVTGFLEVAIWKGTRRLAQESMAFIDDRSLPVAVAVLTDKLATIKGQPTSIHLAMTASVNHRDLMKDLKERDVTPVNDEQTPDLV